MKKFIIKAPMQTLSVQEDDIDYSISSHSNLEQICESFTLFLKACGYNLDNRYVTIDFHDDLK